MSTFIYFFKRKDTKGGKGTGRSWWKGDDIMKTYCRTGSVFSALRQGKKLQLGLRSRMEGKSGIGLESAAFCLIFVSPAVPSLFSPFPLC